MVSQTSIGSIPKPNEFLKKFFGNCNGAQQSPRERAAQLLAPPDNGAATPKSQD